MLRRRSECYGKSFHEVLSKEVYNRLKNYQEHFFLMLDTMEIIGYTDFNNNYEKYSSKDYVIFGIKNFNGVKFVRINDFLDITFPCDWLKMEYNELLTMLKAEGIE